MGNYEQIHTSVLNLIFQQANVCWCGNFVKAKFRDLQSLLVCPIILFENLPSLGSNEFLADGPDWHLVSGVVSGFRRSLVTCGDVCSVTSEIQGLNPPGQGDEEDDGGFTKTFPDIPCVVQVSGDLSLRISNPRTA